MNMRTFKYGLILLFGIILFASCKKEPERIFEVNNTVLLPPNAGKDKLKTTEQYVAILYTNLFQQALSPGDVYNISVAIESVGDFELAREVLINNFMNNPGVNIPSSTTMNADKSAFIKETYNRFLLRNPTEAELTWFENYLVSNPNITPELVYYSFAISDEYMYY